MKIKLLLIFFCFLFFVVTKSTALPLDEGKNIFTSRCMACHRIDKDFAGPALANVNQRHTTDWIIKFVHSSQAVIKSGDIPAIALYSKFNNTIMPDHPDLTDNNIKSIVEYINEESAKVGSVRQVPFERPYELQPNYTPLGHKNIGLIISFLASVTALILVLLFAVQVKELGRKMNV
ncbi:MAG: cytochrome c [Ginsengibacter sp.]